MTFISALLRTNATALAALVVVACVLAVVSAALAWLAPSAALGVAGSALVVFSSSLLLGAPLVIGVGAPLYAFFWRRGSASWTIAAFIGLGPGLIILGSDWEIGAVALVCGAVVAFATHAFCGAGSNHSFKPTPSARLNSRR
jgi:hypothetical protein